MINTLIVDDDRTSLLLLGKIVEEYCDCTKCESGAEAITAIRESLLTGKPFDLMFIDLQLEDMDGREILKIVRDVEMKQSIANEDRCKIIMVTGERDILTRKECQSLGGDAYITKPIDGIIIKTRLKILGLLE